MSVRRHHSEPGLRYWARGASNGGGVNNSLISNLLSLELELQQKSRELLDSYKECQDWFAVGQLAQTLVTNSSRISDLKRCLQSQEQLPYLEKISESDKSHLEVEAFPSTTVLESLEDSPIDSEKAGGSLFKAPYDVLNKLDSGSKDLPSGQCANVEECPPEDLKCSVCAPSASLPEEVGFAITSAHLTASNHTDSVRNHSQTEGEKKFGSEDIAFRVEDMDDLEDQMEKLADQFADRSEECGLNQETEVPVAITLDNPIVGTELEVPEYPKATYSSSDSSEFFTPRNSLYLNEGETSSGEAEDNQYEDAQSGNEDALPDLVSGEIPLTFSITKVPVENEEYGDLYSIIPFRIVGFPSSPVVHYYSEFAWLGEQLASTGQRLMLEIDSEPTGGDASEDLEAFLNQAAGDPQLRKMDCFCKFLQSGLHSHPKLFQHCGMFITVNLALHLCADLQKMLMFPKYGSYVAALVGWV